MRALIINMATATDRMGFMAAQMDDLGLDRERIEAVTPATLSPPECDPVWHRWQRPMRVTEMALCVSHMMAWERVEALGHPCLVLEDDAVLAPGLPGFLAQVAGLRAVEHINLETHGRKKLLARRMHPDAPIRRLYQDRVGSAAYVVWPAVARKLLAHARRIGAPSDALISSTYAMRSYQADPALAVQLDQCPRYGWPQAIPGASLIGVVGKPALASATPAQRRAFRARRIAAQLHMGVRQLWFAAVAKRRHVPPVAAWASTPKPGGT